MFESILYWFNSWMGNYGLAVIAFTILVRIVMSPFDYKSRVSMRKMSKLQPKMAVLQKKYANDKEKLNRKMSELYKQEGVSPLSGCWPILLSYPILIIMFNAMRNVANQQMALQALELLRNPTQEPGFLNFLWIKNLVMADSPMAGRMVNDVALVQAGTGSWEWALQEFTKKYGEWQTQGWAQELSLTAESFNADNLKATVESLVSYMKNVPGGVYNSYIETLANTSILGIFPITIYKLPNGYFILPILSAVSQFVMSKITGNGQPQAAAGDAQAQAQQSTGKFMTWFFPIFSLWICSSSTAAFALYWVASNLIAMGSTVLINKYLDSKEKKAELMQGEGTVR